MTKESMLLAQLDECHLELLERGQQIAELVQALKDAQKAIDSEYCSTNHHHKACVAVTEALARVNQ